MAGLSIRPRVLGPQFDEVRIFWGVLETILQLITKEAPNMKNKLKKKRQGIASQSLIFQINEYCLGKENRKLFPTPLIKETCFHCFGIKT